jgi:hypothetical protein
MVIRKVNIKYGNFPSGHTRFNFFELQTIKPLFHRLEAVVNTIMNLHELKEIQVNT